MPSTPVYGRYYKESNSSGKKSITTLASGRRYPTTDRFYENKKTHGHSSLYNSQLTSASSSSHRYYPSSSGGTHNDRYHQSTGSSGSSRPKTYESSSGSAAVVPRDLRRGSEYRGRYYEKSSGTGIRRIPPPLTPPGPGLVPLMKVPVSSSSRYRQAPPEDHHGSYRRPSASTSSHTLTREKIASLRKATQRTAESVTSKIRKRAASDVRLVRTPTEGETKEKRKKDETNDGEEVVEEEIIGDEEEENGREEEKPKDVGVNEEKNKEKYNTGNTAKVSEDFPQAILKLRCSYCDVQCVSFRDFSYHLRSYQHGKLMTNAVSDMKKKLAKLRLTQRDEQKQLEKSEDGKKTLSDTTSYCHVCELNFRTDPKEHEANDLHNKIKAIVHPHCDVCLIEFRIWKVFLYHSVALEHVKKVALQELKEQEAKGENSVKGTNLSEEELGLELMEQRTVFYCIACVRYFPIREDLEEKEAKLRHCLTISHIKFVEEYRDRMKRLAKKKKAAEAAAAQNVEEDEKANIEDVNDEHETEGVHDTSKDEDADAEGHEGHQEEEEETEVKNDKEDEDEDEIQIHAEEDDTVVTEDGE